MKERKELYCHLVQQKVKLHCCVKKTQKALESLYLNYQRRYNVMREKLSDPTVLGLLGGFGR